MSQNPFFNALFSFESDQTINLVKQSRQRFRKNIKKIPFSRALRLENLEERDLLSVNAINPQSTELDEISPLSELIIESEQNDIDATSESLTDSLQTSAATWTITSNADDNLIGTLRYAISNAIAGDKIEFDLSLQGQTIILSGSDIIIEKGITIDATSIFLTETNEPGLTISANEQSRIFNISGGTNDLPVQLIGLNISYGKPIDDNGNLINGGAILTTGQTEITNCFFSHNSARLGGAIHNSGILTVSQSIFSDNEAIQNGGAILSTNQIDLTQCSITNNAAANGGAISNTGTLQASQSIFSNNIATANGGAIANYRTSVLTNCLIVKNSAQMGGAAYNSVSFKLTNCTCADNLASYGGGIYNHSARTSVYSVNNSIILLNAAQNDNSGPDVFQYTQGSSRGTIRANHSLSSYIAWSSGSANNLNYDSSKPLFNDFENGDYSLTLNSQAVDLGNNELAVDASGNTLTVDLISNNRIVNSTVDIGAYELLFLAKPTNIIFSNYDASAKTVLMSWTDNSDNETGFRVEYSTDNGQTWKLSQILEINATSRTCRSVDNVTTYSFRVRAFNLTSVSDWEFGTFRAVADIATPSNITFSNFDAIKRSVTMSWDDNSDNETGFRIEYSVDGGQTWKLSETMAANSTSRTCWGLNLSANYIFRIKAFNENGSTVWVQKALDLISDIEAPSDIVFSNFNMLDGKVTMAWTDNSDDETGFRVEYSTDNGQNWKLAKNMPANSTSRICSGINFAYSYQFRVRAYNNQGYSTWTEATYNVPKILTQPDQINFIDYNPSKATVVMSWNDNSDNETGFRVEYSIDGGQTWKLSQTLTANTNSRICTGIRTSNTYLFRVLAFNNEGISEWATATFNPVQYLVPDSIFDEEDDWLSLV
ncbi:MAG: fibronectin type III domain-containing protein [Planctomycetia bacterium]|nr:fibronectin type III domain-containing protein [Planctomycetia bacterium]